MPAPSKRGRKKKATTLARVGPVGGPAHETLILAHLTAGGQVRKDTTLFGKSEDITKINWVYFGTILTGDNIASK